MDLTLPIYTSLRNAAIYASQFIPLARKAKDYKAGTSISLLNPHEAIYTPLSRNQVRFIEILPSGTEEAPVRCLLKAVELGPDVRYAALSYVWGDPEVTRDIIVNGVVLPVTVNLESALRQFSKTGFPGNGETGLITQLWVDAISINQQDTQERNHQVTMMASIYRNATSVLSWLGAPDENHHDLALRTMNKVMYSIYSTLGKHPISSADLPEVVRVGFEWMVANLGPYPHDSTRRQNVQWQALKDLSQNQYWSRMWILQEIALARDTSAHWFICGAESICATVFRGFQGFLSACSEPKCSKPRVNNANEALILSFLSDSRFSGLLYIGIAWSFRSKLESGERSLVYNISRLAFQTSVTDPRDFVYAIISLMPNTIQPDYSKSVKDVYLDAVLSDGITRCILPCLKFSGYGYGYINNNSVPSWLPDFSKLGTSVILEADSDRSFLHNIELEPPEITQPSTLRIQGVTFSRVKLVKPLQYRDTEDYSDPKYLQRLCIEYLADFTDLYSYESGEDRLSWARINRPLRTLMDVLSCELEDGQVVTAGAQNTSLPGHLVFFLVSLMTGNPFTEEEKKTAMGRLGVPLEMSLHVFLATALIGVDPEEFCAGLKGVSIPIGQKVGLDHAAMASRAGCRTLFQTDKGELGIGPPNLQAGDIVCALDKCTFSSLLRKHGSSFQHVGICKVAGLSSMNPADMIEKGEMQVETFEID
ncbi:hypothetical protein Daesc_004771 [Daldinia eschscholtzii]|uniref:Heterokaryon incompatibility domain-containing protein n=1 Tax=Daldinia eschscholtzii TaxID=292717 RepID=A0AAX6MRK2_9PEZI